MSQALPGLHLMAKPVGAHCNLDCGYCFYLEKEGYYPPRQSHRMSDEVLQAYVSRYIASQRGPEVEFTWQGGEPLLMGLEFFERAVALQKQLAGGKRISNTLQTNGVLLDAAWCEFLAREKFLVGLSVDGPQPLHDAARPDKQGRGTFDAVMKGLRLLQQQGVEFNVLVTVSSANQGHGREIYRFLKTEGVRFIQFNPVVERQPRPADEAVVQLHFAKPPRLSVPGSFEADAAVTPHSVSAEAYGDFLVEVFDDWIAADVGVIHVMNFEWALAAWCQLPATTCIFSERCGRAAIVEHDGSVYSCDHFMYPEYRLGNLRTDDPAALLASPQQQAFGNAKADTLPRQCRECEFRFACQGECPKNRFIRTADGEAGLNYLCAGYLKYFRHITPAMNRMGALLAQGRDAAEVMQRQG
ncbi:anaerobic sulfatase maturase [Pelomonas sp. SE-A7]|uniref:anaerobic sulfatase maturase n=1 Tax=Pelomonas sp. SE-A7 TaxID=3054953 RepID=UPI00259C8D5D|nr:anaerobic sulfatase maturase [Pelomonas sp. SE-A7]MDM4765057.1 anaerobic sulfatase maturase [Pelomonas sp. SE-A7]